MKKKADKRKFGKHDLLIVLLIVAALLNTVVHFTSPAYKFYKENFKRVFSENEKQFDEIRLRLIPVLTNQLEILRRPSAVFSNSVSFASNSLPVASVSLPRRYFFPDKVFVYDGSWVFQYAGFVYSVGCRFDDGFILSISPTYILTTTAEYYLRRDFKEDKQK